MYLTPTGIAFFDTTQIFHAKATLAEIGKHCNKNEIDAVQI